MIIFQKKTEDAIKNETDGSKKQEAINFAYDSCERLLLFMKDLEDKMKQWLLRIDSYSNEWLYLDILNKWMNKKTIWIIIISRWSLCLLNHNKEFFSFSRKIIAK